MVESNLKGKVRIFVCGKNLKRMDLLSKSDPYCQIFEKVNNNWVLRGKTEVAVNNQSPEWKTFFEIDYFFEKSQSIMFKVMDKDEINADDLIGQSETTISKILGQKAQCQKMDLENNGKKNLG